MIKMKVEITKEEYEAVTSKEQLREFVGKVAIRSGWHPAGYGMYGAELLAEGDKYYAVWERSSCCD